MTYDWSIFKVGLIHAGDRVPQATTKSFMATTDGSTDAATRERWTVEQLELKTRLVTEDPVTWVLDKGTEETEEEKKPRKSLQRIAGVDISFLKGSNEHACASIVVMEYPSFAVLYEAYTYVSLPAPYIAGFLAFREVPALTKLYEDLIKRCPEHVPDVILVDGNGVLHPQGFGLASHFGVLADIPTIGVGKTFLHVDGLTKPDVKKLMQDAKAAGQQVVKIQGHSGRIWGAAICGPAGVQNPVYVSVGHLVSLDTALEIVTACSQYRIPEPIRQADLRSRVEIRKWENDGTVDTTLDRFVRR